MKGIEFDNGSWKIDKRVSVGHLLFAIVMVGSFIVWWSSVSGDLTLALDRIERNSAEIARVGNVLSRHSEQYVTRDELEGIKLDLQDLKKRIEYIIDRQKELME